MGGPRLITKSASAAAARLVVSLQVFTAHRLLRNTCRPGGRCCQPGPSNRITRSLAEEVKTGVPGTARQASWEAMSGGQAGLGRSDKRQQQPASTASPAAARTPPRIAAPHSSTAYPASRQPIDDRTEPV